MSGLGFAATFPVVNLAFKNSLCACSMSGLLFAATLLVVNPFNKFDLYLKVLELFM